MTVEDRYNWEQFNRDELAKKKHPIGYFAYWITYNADLEKFNTKPLRVHIILDCDGAPVPRTISEEVGCVFAQLCPGAEWVYPHWTARYSWGLTDKPGVIVDHRSWLMIILGCCPKFEEYF